MNNVKEEIFEGILKAAMGEYLDNMIEELPTNEELEKTYKIPQKFIKQALRKLKTKKYNRPLAVVYLQRVGVIFLAVSTIAFGILMLDDSVRASVSDAVINWHEKYFEINYIQDDQNSNEEKFDISLFEIGYIPEGYELSYSNESSHMRNYAYTNADNNSFAITISTVSGKNAIDNEDVEIEYTEINGYEACIVYSLNSNVGILIMGNNSFEINISGAIEKDDLIKIAKNIK